MNLVSIAVRIYMLLMGIILLASSALYRWQLDRMERDKGIVCPRSLYYSKIYKSNNYYGPQEEEAPEEETDEERIFTQNTSLCRNMKWWKLFAETGIIGGTCYILFLISLIAFSCCTRSKDHEDHHDEAEDDEPEQEINEKEDVPQIKFRETRTLRTGSKCCATWIMGMTGLFGLTVVTLALSFIFLGSTQLEAISTLDEKGNFGGTLEIYPPLILYISSVWHFVKLCGFSIWLGIIILCPSSLSIGQCVVI